MAEITYSEKLRHPLWQKRRLEIFKRDAFACQLCGDAETELHVHHKSYSGQPWEAPDEELISLCMHCHFLIERFKGAFTPPNRILKIKTYADLGKIVLVAMFGSKMGLFIYQTDSKEIETSIAFSEEQVLQIQELIQKSNTNG